MTDNKLKLKKELEIRFLTVMLFNPDCIPQMAEKIKPEDFEKENQELVSEIIKRSRVGLDSPTLIIELSKLNLEKWSITELSLLTEDAYKRVSSFEALIYNESFEHFYDLVFSLKAEKFLSEKLKSIKDDFCGLDTLSDLRDEIDSMLTKTEHFKQEKSFSEKLDDIYSGIEKEMSSECSSSFRFNNIPSLNTSSGGIKLTNLIGIAGSYKSAKTTLALNMVIDLAKQGIPSGFFSLELSEKEIDDKILGILSGVPYDRIREPKKLTAEDKTKLIEYRSKKKNLPLYIATKTFKDTEIRNKAAYWKDRFGVKVICVDYLGYMRSQRRFDSREREMSHHSGFLKQMGLELDLAIIVLAQLNRTGKNNPGTENLAESIALARDCDHLYVIHSPLLCGNKSAGGIIFNESHFFVKLDTTRHSKYKKQFLLQMKDHGQMVEIASEYDNSYTKSYYPEPLSEPVKQYQESEEII